MYMLIFPVLVERYIEVINILITFKTFEVYVEISF